MPRRLQDWGQKPVLWWKITIKPATVQKQNHYNSTQPKTGHHSRATSITQQTQARNTQQLQILRADPRHQRSTPSHIVVAFIQLGTIGSPAGLLWSQFGWRSGWKCCCLGWALILEPKTSPQISQPQLNLQVQSATHLRYLRCLIQRGLSCVGLGFGCFAIHGQRLIVGCGLVSPCVGATIHNIYAICLLSRVFLLRCLNLDFRFSGGLFVHFFSLPRSFWEVFGLSKLQSWIN